MLGENPAPKEFMNKEDLSIKTIGLVLLIGFIFTSIVYLYASIKENTNTKEKEEIESRINALQDEVDILKSSQVDGKLIQETGASDEEVYDNTTYGFSLTFNDKWQNYQIVERKPDQERDGEAIISNIASYLYVCAPTTSTKWTDEAPGVFCPFVIEVVRADKYENYKNEMGNMAGEYINKNSLYVFLYGSSQGKPEDGDILVNDSKNIISTFKLLQ